MDKSLYPIIFKRKSFHIFRDVLSVTPEELAEIQRVFYTLEPLNRDIRVAMRIVPAAETSCRRGAEYCILLYSEQKDGYLQNIGYIGEQLDLHLAAMDIGALWFGIGRPEQSSLDGLSFVIMLSVSKVQEGMFRKDMFKSKRKPLSEVWQSEALLDVGNIARFAPSACNTQPWLVSQAYGDALTVFRYRQPGKRGIMPADRVTFYNRIDMGIFLLFLELCMDHEDVAFERTLFLDADDACELARCAEYRITGRKQLSPAFTSYTSVNGRIKHA